jgi:hypothetical protein
MVARISCCSRTSRGHARVVPRSSGRDARCSVLRLRPVEVARVVGEGNIWLIGWLARVSQLGLAPIVFLLWVWDPLLHPMVMAILSICLDQCENRRFSTEKMLLSGDREKNEKCFAWFRDRWIS